MVSIASKPNNSIFVLAILIASFFTPNFTYADKSKIMGIEMNAIDKCWRLDPEWRKHRSQLATCSVGYVGKMTNNIGDGLIHYKVTDPSDDPTNPKLGTLRYGASVIQGKVWITFERDMLIKLTKPLLISSFTTIDGRGFDIQIAHNACLMIFKIHDCKSQVPGKVVGPNGKVMSLGQVDGDAIRLVSASKIWIDHNTLSNCEDGLLDVTRGSTNVTISNNRFKFQDKVMLLGHDDGFVRDQNMKVTVVYNHFGPNCNQRMPRIRHGYAHVANNFYLGWLQYAIGGSTTPSLKSEANLFIAPTSGNKEVINLGEISTYSKDLLHILAIQSWKIQWFKCTHQFKLLDFSRMNGHDITWRKDNDQNRDGGEFHSVNDVFENGASFMATKGGNVRKPNYTKEQAFKVADAKYVRSLTGTSGVLRCGKTIC
ncbi:putative pectate lyase [Lupinus albus]|uniref:Pectate lyase n=1 Tax=Lupinus albus TaxID=3870 RepID=A0A6A4Q388_LUPAL|nr:putative pectate lyase [Lupinus albus]